MPRIGLSVEVELDDLPKRILEEAGDDRTIHFIFNLARMSNDDVCAQVVSLLLEELRRRSYSNLEGMISFLKHEIWLFEQETLAREERRKQKEQQKQGTPPPEAW